MRLANYEQQKRSEEETKAIDAFVRVYNKTGTPEYQKARRRLTELRIDSKRVVQEIKKRRQGTDYERALRGSRTRRGMEKRQTLTDYGSMR
ncbi:MAG: hypothetical protein LBJ36_04740 [Synergistaceae bacterium]|nr:hypothetical protein [Synergistaceae bacterium]